MTVEAKKLKNIYDKDQLYVVISNNGKQVVINVGEKTWNKVKELQEETKPVGKIKPTL